MQSNWIGLKKRPIFFFFCHADLQMVNISLRVLSRPNAQALPQMYRQLGTDFDERVLPSITNEVCKNTSCSCFKFCKQPQRYVCNLQYLEVIHACCNVHTSCFLRRKKFHQLDFLTFMVVYRAKKTFVYSLVCPINISASIFSSILSLL